MPRCRNAPTTADALDVGRPCQAIQRREHGEQKELELEDARSTVPDTSQALNKQSP